MFKSRKRIRLLGLVTAFLMLLTMILPCAAYTKQDGDRFYRATSLSTITRIQPLYNTQAQHTQGYITTIHASTNVTKTVSVNVSFTFGFNYYVEANHSFGVTDSESRTVEAGVSYTIESSEPTAKYRISVAFPGQSIRYEIWDTREQERLELKVVDFLPNKNESYRFLEKYE